MIEHPHHAEDKTGEVVDTDARIANQTEKVAMSIEFQARSSISEQSFFAPAISARHFAGHALMRSVGSERRVPPPPPPLEA